MNESVAKLRIYPNRKDLNFDYVLDCLLNLTKREKKINLGWKARLILDKVALHGDDGLFSKDWDTQRKALGLTEAQYFYVIKVLKNAGLIYKSKGRYYLSKTFAEHMTRIASSANAFMMEKGA